MATPPIVPALDEVEDGEARIGVGLCAEAFAIEQLALDRRARRRGPTDGRW